MGSIAKAPVENLACNILNTIVRKAVINRLPPKTMLWSRFDDVISPLACGKNGMDLGCGEGSALPFHKLHWVGVDLHFPSLLRASGKRRYRSLVCTDLLLLGRVFRPKCVDTVAALDLIEHLEKDAARDVIGTMETLARRRVIVLVPNGFVQQDPGAVASNPWMEHRSAWSVREFEDMNYAVVGWSGWRGFAGPHGYVRRKLDPLFQVLMTISQPLVESRPNSAFHLLCWKDLSETRQA